MADKPKDDKPRKPKKPKKGQPIPITVVLVSSQHVASPLSAAVLKS